MNLTVQSRLQGTPLVLFPVFPIPRCSELTQDVISLNLGAVTSNKQLRMNQTRDSVKGRILFVEDHTDTRELVLLVLNREGYEVNLASGFDQAREFLGKNSYDLILLDWYYEDGTGLDLCKLIRQTDRSTPVYFYTAVAYNTELHKAIEAGAQGCFVKPVHTEHLIKAISLQLGRRA
jgi:CheY-like chemotaxis protein